eukprot:TRINITY_DN12302_c1_g2_i3.p1 TRINITY_DN12302_c1_g2~~TRINITY_DN12302_c1_g2_i3.p1  ORF type:complete len:722 (-),score=292.85 TRINITY_DN12302_c1_g2_i3:163-2247(-)
MENVEKVVEIENVEEETPQTETVEEEKATVEEKVEVEVEEEEVEEEVEVVEEEEEVEIVEEEVEEEEEEIDHEEVERKKKASAALRMQRDLFKKLGNVVIDLKKYDYSDPTESEDHCSIVITKKNLQQLLKEEPHLNMKIHESRRATHSITIRLPNTEVWNSVAKFQNDVRVINPAMKKLQGDVRGIKFTLLRVACDTLEESVVLKDTFEEFKGKFVELVGEENVVVNLNKLTEENAMNLTTSDEKVITLLNTLTSELRTLLETKGLYVYEKAPGINALMFQRGYMSIENMKEASIEIPETFGTCELGSLDLCTGFTKRHYHDIVSSIAFPTEEKEDGEENKIGEWVRPLDTLQIQEQKEAEERKAAKIVAAEARKKEAEAKEAARIAAAEAKKKEDEAQKLFDMKSEEEKKQILAEEAARKIFIGNLRGLPKTQVLELLDEFEPKEDQLFAYNFAIIDLGSDKLVAKAIAKIDKYEIDEEHSLIANIVTPKAPKAPKEEKVKKEKKDVKKAVPVSKAVPAPKKDMKKEQAKKKQPEPKKTEEEKEVFNLFIVGLPEECTTKDLRSFMKELGIRKMNLRRGRAFFSVFGSRTAEERAEIKKKMHNKKIGGQRIKALIERPEIKSVEEKVEEKVEETPKPQRANKRKGKRIVPEAEGDAMSEDSSDDDELTIRKAKFNEDDLQRSGKFIFFVNFV